MSLPQRGLPWPYDAAFIVGYNYYNHLIFLCFVNYMGSLLESAQYLEHYTWIEKISQLSLLPFFLLFSFYLCASDSFYLGFHAYSPLLFFLHSLFFFYFYASFLSYKKVYLMMVTVMTMIMMMMVMVIMMMIIVITIWSMSFSRHCSKHLT